MWTSLKYVRIKVWLKEHFNTCTYKNLLLTTLNKKKNLVVGNFKINTIVLDLHGTQSQKCVYASLINLSETENKRHSN